MHDDFTAWIGRSERSTDRLDPQRCNALRTALGDPCPPLEIGDALPPLYHWLHFWNVQPPAGLGADGHPAKGGFLPPVPLPRRMWAGGRVQFVAPLTLGETATRTSTILAIEHKTGGSGPLVFVTVERRIAGAAGDAIVEQQDLVYRAPTGVMAPLPPDAPAPQASWCDRIDPDPVLLFRYSALTMNGHRIHYDLPYAQAAEDYPALVVHGPLQATLLATLAERALGRELTRYDFRGAAPAFAGYPLHFCGEATDDGIALRTEQGGTLRMTAQAA